MYTILGWNDSTRLSVRKLHHTFGWMEFFTIPSEYKDCRYNDQHGSLPAYSLVWGKGVMVTVG